MARAAGGVKVVRVFAAHGQVEVVSVVDLCCQPQAEAACVLVAFEDAKADRLPESGREVGRIALEAEAR